MIKNLSNAILSVNCILQLFSISIVHESFDEIERVSTTYISDVLDVVIRSQLSGALSARLFPRFHGASHMQSNRGLRPGILL